jgi:hypothetical protein
MPWIKPISGVICIKGQRLSIVLKTDPSLFHENQNRFQVVAESLTARLFKDTEAISIPVRIQKNIFIKPQPDAAVFFFAGVEPEQRALFFDEYRFRLFFSHKKDLTC